MPVDPRVQEFPRMLFRGKDDAETLVVATADEKAAALANGWRVKLLPGEAADEYLPSEQPSKKGRKAAE